MKSIVSDPAQRYLKEWTNIEAFIPGDEWPRGPQ